MKGVDSMNTAMCPLNIAASSILAACLLLCSCNTPVPPTGASSPSAIAFHYNRQTAGIYGALYWSGQFSGMLVDDEYVADYKELLISTKPKIAPANPFNPLAHPYSEYTIKYNLNGGAVITESLTQFLASDLWPSNFTATESVTAEGSQSYQSMLRASRAP